MIFSSFYSVLLLESRTILIIRIEDDSTLGRELCCSTLFCVRRVYVMLVHARVAVV